VGKSAYTVHVGDGAWAPIERSPHIAEVPPAPPLGPRLNLFRRINPAT